MTVLPVENQSESLSVFAIYKTMYTRFSQTVYDSVCVTKPSKAQGFMLDQYGLAFSDS